MIVATFMVVIVVACLGFISVVSYQSNTEDARDDRSDEADNGRTMATMGPKKALVTKIESAPVSGAVIRKDMQDERDAPLLRISATTGTTEQLHSGTGTPMAELKVTDFRLSSRSQRRMA